MVVAREAGDKPTGSAAIELVLARLLRIGSMLAAALLGAGLVLTALGMTQPGSRLITSGLVVLLGTPILRVAAAGIIFIREKDWYFVLFCLVVLCSLVLGIYLGKSA